MKQLIVVLLFATAAVGQQATRVGGHTLGESFQQWLSVNQLAGMCDQPHHDKQVCKRLNSIRDSGHGAFSTYSDEKTRQEFIWLFSDGVLAEVDTRRTDSTAQQIQLLTDVYGAPSKTESVPYQNSYGAAWDCPRVTWIMPDGALIVGVETINSGGGITGPFPLFSVSFYSAGAVRHMATQSEVNPYR
jgi:hypothetical protein